MSEDRPGYEDVVMSPLLGAARRTYTTAVRTALFDAGFDDMPRSGGAVIARIARQGRNLRDVAGELAVSKQAASQLVDTLVARGYVERDPDPHDRRRVTIGLTERGRSAAAEIARAIDQVDAELAAKVSAEDLARTRATLGVLADMGHTDS
ncbi:MAG TPA: MarR family transcriptional regulator [Acidimicrobiales bacterium]|nr:MarR family transcriptional regulator [Acidimicrobiales bacterium]